MDCLDVRGRLAEHALATLPREESAFVDRHLEWCAGCRKEADELAEGAAVLGLAATDGHHPPAGLEEQVVGRVRAAAGGPPRRRRSWPAATAGAVAAAVAIAAVAGAVILSLRSNLEAEVSEQQQRADQAEERARELTKRIEKVIQRLLEQQPPSGPRDVTRQTTLSPTGGRSGGAGALVYIRPQGTDWSLVIVGGLSRSEGPYRVVLRDDYGKVLKVGKIYRLDADGGATVFREFNQDLRAFRYVQVLNVLNAVVLQGTLEESSAQATAAPTITPTLPS